jgi:galactokinase
LAFSTSGNPGPNAVRRAAEEFLNRHHEPAPLLVRAPGRVNVIGEHTDYNDGFVLPIALPFDTAIAAGPMPEAHTVDVSSEGFGSVRFDPADDPRSTEGWARYVHGVMSVIGDWLPAGATSPGWRGTIATDIPAGASLSSSAALEVAVSLVISALTESELSVVDLARIGQRVENDVMGLPSGLLDQLASAGGTAGHATLIDCRDLSMRAVPMPPDATIVVMDTGTRRELVESEYANRQATCAAAAATLGLDSLRDATEDDLTRLEGDELRRTRHVITENARTLAAVAAMEANDLAELGRLMVGSHESLRDDYEVTGPALDAIVDVALDCPGVYGARMTGGGFAGGAIALVDEEAVDRFCLTVEQRYQAPPSQPAVAPLRLYPTPPSAGAAIIER